MYDSNTSNRNIFDKHPKYSLIYYVIDLQHTKDNVLHIFL
jgi:hypothetical protein